MFKNLLKKNLKKIIKNKAKLQNIIKFNTQ